MGLKLSIIIIPFVAFTLGSAEKNENILISSQEQRKKPLRCGVRLLHRLPRSLLYVSGCILCEQ
jgi:hypothetical protein